MALADALEDVEEDETSELNVVLLGTSVFNTASVLELLIEAKELVSDSNAESDRIVLVGTALESIKSCVLEAPDNDSVLDN